jgi:hypothetical protein
MALVDIDNPAAIHDQRLLGLFQFWHGRLNGRRILQRRFRPRGLARWMDNVMLIDVPGDIADSASAGSAPTSPRCSHARAGTGIEAMT